MQLKKELDLVIRNRRKEVDVKDLLNRMGIKKVLDYQGIPSSHSLYTFYL
jgi:hypothetical protein